MTFASQRFLLNAGAGLLFASAIAACAGGSNSTLPSALQPARVSSRADIHGRQPAPASTEFFNGITPNSTPRGITYGPKGMWFTQTASNQIGYISAQGAVTEYNAPPAGENNIVEGPDGNLWFTMDTADTIGRMTPHGTINQVTVGNEAYGPWDITEGSDHNLWFTFRSPSTNAIGRVTTGGVVTLFTSGLSPGDVAVHDVTRGPDGNVWFTEEFGNRIGKITPSGTITEYSNGITANAGLVDITAGPDGNVWFTENSANKIGRITPAGVVTEFSQGISPGANPGAITMSQSAVWFTETNASNVGRVATNGSIVEYPIPAQLGADIAAAPTGTLAITDYSGNGIVAVTP